ncbi:CotG/ExsB N-terminal domain-containing protein [Neobacillus sp. SAB-20_R2A]|uniref:CotG/ExsB N-terminal domain-containing protein n=1 Tax=Neobacillus sp. SAB-20_R2A TaxID=3120519 RepID=UPI003C6E386E
MHNSFRTPFSVKKEVLQMEEREFSPEDIQRAAEGVQRGGFGDFMFMDPGRHRGTSGNRGTSSQTSRRTTSRPMMTSSRHTTRRRTSRKRTSRRLTHNLECTNWRNTDHGRHQTKSCWKDGNMWVFKSRKRG